MQELFLIIFMIIFKRVFMPNFSRFRFKKFRDSQQKPTDKTGDNGTNKDTDGSKNNLKRRHFLYAIKLTHKTFLFS